jgi:hypothetical protein
MPSLGPDSSNHQQRWRRAIRTILTATALTLTLSAGAQAQQILSAGSLFAGSTQFRAVCYFYNSGTSNLTLVAPQITNSAGTALSLVVNECGATLLSGRTCGIAANVANNLPYNCNVAVSPGKGPARGVFEMRNSGGTSLTNVELR